MPMNFIFIYIIVFDIVKQCFIVYCIYCVVIFIYFKIELMQYEIDFRGSFFFFISLYDYNLQFVQK